ncbi:Isochorismatase hydrolase [Peniophora sp. CONT]|nr:Isochorismatase hydrolase [Peniophora sp. CONT]
MASAPGSSSAHPTPPLSPDPELPVHRVLLVLDAQVGLLSPPPRGIPSSQTLRTNLTRILASARAAPHRPRIIHVRNSGDHGEDDYPSTPGWQLIFKPELEHDEHVLDKKKNNAFAGTKLGELVPAEALLVVVGAQSDYCVRATCAAALARGNEVIVIRGAHGTFDRLEVLAGGAVTSAKDVAKEIDAILAEMGVHLFEMDDVDDLFVD